MEQTDETRVIQNTNDPFFLKGFFEFDDGSFDGCSQERRLCRVMHAREHLLAAWITHTNTPGGDTTNTVGKGGNYSGDIQ